MPKLRYDFGILPRYCAAFLEGLASCLPDPATIIEIGTYEGNSLMAMLRGLSCHETAHVWTIDIGDCVKADELIVQANLPGERYTRIIQSSAEAAEEWDQGLVDMVYVDGDHSEDGVRADIKDWSRHLRPGGLMVFDDYQTPNYAGSTQAINALMVRSNGWRKVGQVGRCIAFEKMGGAGAWQQDIGAWKTFWPTEIDWRNDPLGDEAWTWVSYGWQWPGYPEVPASQRWLSEEKGHDMDLEDLRRKSTEAMTPEEIALLPDRDKAIRGLIYDASIYDANWFHGQGWQHPWCDRLMGWLVGEFGPFGSSLDLGAGDGYYSHVLAGMGANPAVAVEVSYEALSAMESDVRGMVHDLREPLDLGRGFDLVVCLEVAEHLPLESADTLCDTIARHCPRRLIFTAAPPGQGGHGHCNLQPFSFWADRLSSRGVVFNEEETDRTRDAWKRILGDQLPWLSRNISVFERRQ